MSKAGNVLEEKQIRVLQVFGSLNMGGAECRMMDVYRNIDRSMVQFDFVTLTKGKQVFEDEIAALGGEIYKIKSPREIGIIKHIKSIRNCIRKGNYSAIHAHTSYHCGMVMFAAWLEHVPIRISHARTTGSKSKSKSKAFSLILGRFLINLFSTKKLAISIAAGKYVFGRHGFEVLPNAIDVKKYQAINDKEIQKVKRELEINDTDFVVGQIGRFASMKNHCFTIKWFNEYCKQNANAKLVLVGDGELKTDMEELSERFGLSDKIVFTGLRCDVHRLIHVFDVLFFPSVFEGLGGVALEAQAAGIPVVESDTVPIETDMGLGMVQRVSLHEENSVWIEAVSRSKEIQRPSYDTINKAFHDKRYTLLSSVKRLSEIYKGKN